MATNNLRSFNCYAGAWHMRSRLHSGRSLPCTWDEKWKPLRMDCWGLIVSIRDWLCSPRLPELQRWKLTEAFSLSIVRFLCPPTLWLLGPRTQSLSIVRGSITLYAGTLCEAFTWLWSKISWNIGQISCEIGDSRRRLRRKLWKKLDAASRFESFFCLSLECQRSAGEVAHQCTYVHWVIRVHQTKSLASLQLVWTGR